MAQKYPPKRTISMGVGDESSPGDATVADSPYTSRMPLRGLGAVHASYGVNSKPMATPELIRPSPGNPSRQSEPQTAMFSLLATIVGGGVLSLPYAMMKTGVLTGILLIALAAIVGDFSLYMLCSCSRRTGKMTYVQVGQAAFGDAGGVVTTSALLVMTVFVMIAYMVLVKDIWSDLVSVVVGVDLSEAQRNQVLVAALLLVFPATLSTNVHSLRHFSYVGFFSVILLTISIGYRTMEASKAEPTAKLALKLTADSWGDIMDAFPILALSFMAHFNMLSVHSKFVNPTRERLKGLLHGTMSLTAALYMILALCGYLYAYDNTKDDILLNFEPGDRVMVLGRVGMGTTMLVAVIMLVLPCREAFYEAGAAASVTVQGWFGCKEYLPVDGNVQSTPGGTPRVVTSCFKVIRHVLATFMIIGFCLYSALAVPGVSVVWSVAGSSVGFAIAYLLPAVFYLKIRSHKAFNMRKAGAWAVLLCSSVMIVSCTHHALKKAMG